MTVQALRDAPVVLYDTTLRDGTQGENITLSLADKLRIARMLDEFGMPFIEGGWPGSNPKDIEFFATARTMRWEQARLAAFGSTRHRSNKPGDDPNLRELVAAETPVVTIFGKSWLLHVTEVLGATPAENLDMIADSVGFVADRGREAIYDAEHFFDGYKADRDYALETLRAARGAGARTLVLCDTNGGTMTDELVRIIGDVRGTLEADPAAPAVTWGIHTHNDAELAVANSMAAGDRRDPPRPGHHQRLRRAGRQRQHGQHPGQPGAQDDPRAGPGRRRRSARPDRAVALDRRDRQRHARTTTSRTSAARPSLTRAASTAPRWPRSSGATSTSIRPRSATPAGSSSPSSAAGPTSRSGPSSSATSSRASWIRASSRS